MKGELKNKFVKWHTDNYACSIVAKKGSNKNLLQELALKIFDTTAKNNISLDVCWIPRENNELADKFSKEIDYDDWYVTPELFELLTPRRWGKVSIDRFASEKNCKTLRFNSKRICPNTEGVDAFTFDWGNEVNWLVPPVYLIWKTINHFLSSKYQSKGILVAISTFLAITYNKIRKIEAIRKRLLCYK